MSLSRLELQCFGAPTARVDGERAPDTVLWAKHLALLVYLALSTRRTRTRSQLIGALWPEATEAKARHSLNQALSRLREALGRDRLASNRDAVTLVDTALEVDAERFDALVDRDPEAAVSLLAGEFLEGFAVSDAPGFEEWAAHERARYAARASAALVASGERSLAALEYGRAADAARRSLALQPYHQPAVELLLRALALGGDVAGALAAYQEFADRLAAQLGEQPGVALRALVQRVRMSHAEGRSRRPDLDEIPLAGRAELHRQVFTLVAGAARAGSAAVFISGDPGTGKSRLLAECGRRLSLVGAEVIATRALESDQDVPWSLMRALLGKGLLRAPGSRAADPGALSLLASLAGGSDGAGEARPPAGAGAAADALASLLRAIADERPLGLLLDDLHCADDASLAALDGALEQLRAAPVTAVMASLHAWDDASPVLLKLRADVGRTFAGIAVRLAPFSEDDVRELVRGASSWCGEDGQRPRLARRVYHETGGNPFLAATLLLELEREAALREEVLEWPPQGRTLDAPLPLAVPDLVRRVIGSRLRRLGTEPFEVLRAACVLGPALDPSLVAAVTGLPSERVEDALTRLEYERLLAFDGDRPTLAAPLVAGVVFAEWLLPGERRSLRARAVAALAARDDLPARLQRVTLQAEVDRGSGDGAFAEALQLGRAAQEAGRARIAKAALRLAEGSPAAATPQGHEALEDLRRLLS